MALLVSKLSLNKIVVIESSSGKFRQSKVSAFSLQPELWSVLHSGHANAPRGTSWLHTEHSFGVFERVRLFWVMADVSLSSGKRDGLLNA